MTVEPDITLFIAQFDAEGLAPGGGGGVELGNGAAAALQYGKEVRLTIRPFGRHGLDAFERAEKDVQQVQHMDAVAQKNAMLARVGAGKTCMAIDGAGRQ